MLRIIGELRECFIVENTSTGEKFRVNCEYETFRAINRKVKESGINIFGKSMKQVLEALLYIENIETLTEVLDTYNPVTDKRYKKEVFIPV